jgi:hypothetical protein
VVGLSACGKKEDTLPAQPPALAPQVAAPQASVPAPAGVALSSITLGKAVGADGAVADASVLFGPGDTVHASVATAGTGSVTLGARWIYDQAGKGVTVAEESRPLAVPGPTTTTFRLSRPEGLPAGDYEVEILLGGRVVAMPSFKVQQAAVAPRLRPSSEGQRRAAALVYYGKYVCDRGQVMTISRSRQSGYVDLRAGRRQATLAPVLSSTGAVRLEQVHRGALLVVQIPSKSMLLDQHAGKRLLDDCLHAAQKAEAAAAAMRHDSLGMNLPGQVSSSDPPARR